MARVVLLTGGNSGDVKRTLQAAQQLVNAKVGAVLRCSHRYETKPWGFDADGVFSNQALEVSTDPAAFGSARRRAGHRTGAGPQPRRRSCRESPHGRELYLAADRYRHPFLRRRGDRQPNALTVPHPLMGEREFALVPLCEIMRQRRHPVTGRTVGEMLEELRNK